MLKVFIHSQNIQYAQYLSSIIQQIQVQPELSVEYNSYAYKPYGRCSQSDLFVFYHNSDQKDLAAVLQVWPFKKIVITSNNGCQQNYPETKFFSRPLKSSDFLKCIHQWYLSEVSDLEFLGDIPAEPYLVGHSQDVTVLRKKIMQVSKTDLSVLICGATGTGKGVAALALHNNSEQHKSPFLEINCANLPGSLLESELFGYKKGTFTGAWKDKPGRLEFVDGGSIFLDEISEMSPHMQAKLLQVLQEKEFYPLGSQHSVKIKARLVAATNADLQEAIAYGRFREDLYYRLAVVRLDLPDLKQRKEDVPVLIEYFLDKFCMSYNKNEIPQLSNELWELMLAYDWPGNVRELESSIKCLVALEDEDVIKDKISKKMSFYKLDNANTESEKITSFPPGMQTNTCPGGEPFMDSSSLKNKTYEAICKAESQLINNVLQQTNGNKKQAARILEVSYKSLLKKIKIYGI